MERIEEFRQRVKQKYLNDKRYNASPEDTQQRYSLRNKFGFYFEYRKFKETINLFNHARIDLSRMKILDIGCHKGSQLNNLAFVKGTSKDLYGIDLMPNFIKIAKEINPSINFKVMDVHDLKFQDNFFNLITLFYFLNCISSKDREKFAKTLSRKLKKGGYVLLFEFSDNFLINSIRKLTKTIKGIDNSYVEYASDNIIKKYFKDFKIIKSRKVINFLSHPLTKILPTSFIELLDQILPKNYYICLLQKIK